MSKFRPIDGRVHPFGDFEVLVGRLQQQSRLGLDQEQDAERLSACSASGLSDLDEQVDRLLPGLALGDRAAGLGGDVGGAEFGAEAEGARGCGRSGPGGNAARGR